ncbi:class I SAM-dependent methyltransferase [Nocardia amamiensis]|uniref:class I SAM-dependent methyltransferase n=1 Tax=Nocardia amamiensis TaxID=404578 RepID=UPI00082BB802|nr:class I SAM-dependent methyltransferase [Nocardia amamiensis]
MDTWRRPTAWTTSGVADDFVRWDDTVGWLLGYPFVFTELRLGQPDVTAVLDLGCGPGYVARRAAEEHDVDVHAADISPAMLAIASTRFRHPRVTHHRTTGCDLAFLPDSSVDAAMSCFVLVCVPEPRQLQDLVSEVRRVLRPGGRFAVLNAHPGHTGVAFDSFQIGQPGVDYRPGDPMPVRLRRTDGEWMDIVDTYWSGDTYRELLLGANFARVWQVEPTLDDARRLLGAAAVSRREWTAERETPPFLLVVGQK